MNLIADRMLLGDKTIDHLIAIGDYEYTEANDNVNELFRVFWKAHSFREWDFSTGIQKRIGYELMQEVYQDFECQLSYSSYIELFPLIDELFVQASIKKASEKKPSS